MAITDLEVYSPSGVTYDAGVFTIAQPASRWTVRITDYDGGTVEAPGQSVPDEGLVLDGLGSGTTPDNSYDSSQYAEIYWGDFGFGNPVANDGGIERALTLQDPDGGTITAYEIVNVLYTTDADGNDERTVTSLGWIGTSELQPGTTYSVLAENRVTPLGGDGTLAAPQYTDLVGAVCFAAGTRIRTPEGWAPVETIRPGMRVMTRDRGAQPVLWAGKRTIGTVEQLLNPKLRPIAFAPGALGRDQPGRALCLSRQHRVLVHSPLGEGLAPAHLLDGWPGIARRDRLAPVTYCHLLLDHHAILDAEGLGCESLYPGPMAFEMLGPRARTEVMAITGTAPGYQFARPVLRRRDLRDGPAVLVPGAGCGSA